MFGRDSKYQDGEAVGRDSVPPEVIVSSDVDRSNRIPPGQTRTRKWPVLDAHGTPRFSLPDWKLEVFGLVRQPLSFTWNEFQSLPRVRVLADFHCVTRWSRLGNLWEGVAVKYLLERAGVLPSARFVLLHGCDQGWSTNLPLADFDQDDVLVADRHDGEPLSADHGGPVRAIVPRLYAWKSAKWLRGIELIAEDRLGYWEAGGYHVHGDPWVVNAQNPDGERFGRD